MMLDKRNERQVHDRGNDYEARNDKEVPLGKTILELARPQEANDNNEVAMVQNGSAVPSKPSENGRRRGGNDAGARAAHGAGGQAGDGAVDVNRGGQPNDGGPGPRRGHGAAHDDALSRAQRDRPPQPAIRCVLHHVRVVAHLTKEHGW